MTCFSLANPQGLVAKYRLGNECEVWSETHFTFVTYVGRRRRGLHGCTSCRPSTSPRPTSATRRTRPSSRRNATPRPGRRSRSPTSTSTSRGFPGCTAGRPGRDPLLQARVGLHQRLLLLEPLRRRRRGRGHQPGQGPAPQLRGLRHRRRARDAAGFAPRLLPDRRLRRSERLQLRGIKPATAARSRSGSSPSRTSATRCVRRLLQVNNPEQDLRRLGCHRAVRAAGSRRRQQAGLQYGVGRGHGLRDARALLLPGLLAQPRPQRSPVPCRRRATIQPLDGSAGRPTFIYQYDDNFLGISGPDHDLDTRRADGWAWRSPTHFKVLGEAGYDRVTKGNGSPCNSSPSSPSPSRSPPTGDSTAVRSCASSSPRRSGTRRQTPPASTLRRTFIVRALSGADPRSACRPRPGFRGPSGRSGSLQPVRLLTSSPANVSRMRRARLRLAPGMPCAPPSGGALYQIGRPMTYWP